MTEWTRGVVSSKARAQGSAPGWTHGQVSSQTRAQGRAQGFEIGGNRNVVFAGHGSFATVTDKAPKHKFFVPKGMRIVFWVFDKEPFYGEELDRRRHISDLLNYQFHPTARGGTGAMVTNWQTVANHLPEVYEAGQPCRAYRLTPPTGLTLGNRAGDERFITVADRGPENIGHRLDDLIQANLGLCTNATIHWAACRVHKDR